MFSMRMVARVRSIRVEVRGVGCRCAQDDGRVLTPLFLPCLQAIEMGQCHEF